MIRQIFKPGLQRRLLLLLLIPLSVLSLISAYLDYRAAGNAALQQDQQLLRLMPLFADSVVAPGAEASDSPVLLLAPDVEDFLRRRSGFTAHRIADLEGRFLSGEEWLATVAPATPDPEFHSVEDGGVIYRVVSQRLTTGAGELLLQLADGSDARQRWVRSVLFKVVLPNLFLLLAAGFAVNWAVATALQPLLNLKDAVEKRSPGDLSAIDPRTTPAEVRPLVSSLNRLFGLVNDQAEGQRRFVADAAHQLRTPLAGLQAQVEAWAERASGGPIGAPITLPANTVLRLRDATRRTTQLANQLLALSRADATTMREQPLEIIDLKQLCESVLGDHLDAASARNIDLGLEVENASAMGHAWQLRELLSNLVDNAVKYTQRHGEVTLRCGRDSCAPLPGGAFLEVEDNGPGIPKEERRLALQRFYRVPGTAAEGNGLGLAIADEIARLHESQLQLLDSHAVSGRGLRVRLSLPLVTSPAESLPAVGHSG
ncbi:MAG: ATP-binding protein [Pseudomonadota bacterium]